MHAGFTFDDAAEIVGYLADLGISDAYFSPYLAARPGSTHGYDVFDHGRVNPEVGGEEAHDRLLQALARAGLGRVLDVVPNHMGIGGGNPYWAEVLEDGPLARSAALFDIDWKPLKEELEDRILIPVLGDQYGKVLEEGQLVPRRDGGKFVLDYFEARLPLTPRSYALILGRRPGALVERLGTEDGALIEYRSILAATRNLPPRDTTDPAAIELYRMEKEAIRRRIDRLCGEDGRVRAFVEENLEELRGQPGEPRSFDALHELLEQQVYRLAYWRVAAEEINYRRFFDVNELAGIRTEAREVFEATHRLILSWVEQGGVTALRIDHPDGLADPAGYLEDLQEGAFLAVCRGRLAAGEFGEAPWREVEPELRALYREAAADPRGPLGRWFPVVIEKILTKAETPPDTWRADGTVGYKYLNMLNGVFVDPSAEGPMDATYVEFTGDDEPFDEVVYDAKTLIARASLSSELNIVARQLNRVSEHDRRSRDFTLNALRRALREIVACFPVYRTYVRPGEPVSDRDRRIIDAAVGKARRRSPTVDPSVYEFIRQALLLEHPEGTTEEERAAREHFVRRFQQLTGPLTAKGVEDTAFYRQVKLASLNEVGGEPTRFGVAPSSFHAYCTTRMADWPGAFSTTATHDTKRGEDTRVRIDALSEMPDEWRTRLGRWKFRNDRLKVKVDGSRAPDPREEYLIYQTLLGAWPFGEGQEDQPPSDEFIERVQQYMGKALREAKRNTSWTDPSSAYVDAVSTFIREALAGEGSDVFLRDFLPFQRRLARVGVVHSLAQTLLKVGSPGVPDVYQGCELWDLSLVDPDNRRPVDYPRRRAFLEKIRRQIAGGADRASLARSWLDSFEDGLIKMYVLWTALGHRKAEPALYAQGSHRPLEALGDRRDHLIAFGRAREGKAVGVVAPRLVYPMMGEEADRWPVGPDAWGDTSLLLPEGLSPRWRNLLTDEVVEVEHREGQAALSVASAFRTIPLALLVAEN
jgi:(1->4)-alpha-D-glucan 1-alpha-D-glucosylmutase